MIQWLYDTQGLNCTEHGCSGMKRISYISGADDRTFLKCLMGTHEGGCHRLRIFERADMKNNTDVKQYNLCFLQPKR